MTAKPPKPKKDFDLNLAIIVSGLGLLGLIWVGYSIVYILDNSINAEAELCKAFPHKCPTNSPYNSKPSNEEHD